MLVAHRHGLGGLGAIGYACSGGVCRATSPTQQLLFVKLQKELNRVRPMFGLPADVAVDGVLGTSTLAKLIKLSVKMVGDPNNARFDNVFDKYAIELGSQLPTVETLAADALNVAQALERNGLTMQHYWAQQDAISATPTPTATPFPPNFLTQIFPRKTAVNVGSLPHEGPQGGRSCGRGPRRAGAGRADLGLDQAPARLVVDQRARLAKPGFLAYA